MVCRELLSILGVQTKYSDVLSRHSKVSPAQLPVWLPESILSEMVARWKHILRQDITRMISDASKQ